MATALFGSLLDICIRGKFYFFYRTNGIFSQVSEGDVFTKNGHLLVGDCVTNAIFHFSKSSPILDLALDIFSQMYNPQGWATGGPDVLQRALLTQCGLDPSHKLRQK